MKKIFMTLVAVILAVCANAQVFIGGTAGISSVKSAGEGNETAYKIIPEIGYDIDSDNSIGIAFGFGRGSSNIGYDGFNPATANIDQKYATINPYFRYKIASIKSISLYSELGFSYTHYNDLGNLITIGIRPVVAFNVSKHVMLVSKIGFLGYKSFSPKSDNGFDTRSNDLKSHAWGLDLDGNNIQFGIYYKF